MLLLDLSHREAKKQIFSYHFAPITKVVFLFFQCKIELKSLNEKKNRKIYKLNQTFNKPMGMNLNKKETSLNWFLGILLIQASLKWMGFLRDIYMRNHICSKIS